MLFESEILFYQKHGYIGPYSLGNITAILDYIETHILSGGNSYSKYCLESRYPDSRIIHDLCSNPKIVERVSGLLGRNVLLWNAVFFNKGPGGGEVPWHQDQEFLLLRPVINVTAWMAIDDVDKDNGCLQIIPGSHASSVPHLARQHKRQFPARADIRHISKDRSIDIVLKQGEFILMHPNVLHHSSANLSTRRRLGLVARYTVPGVIVMSEGTARGQLIYCVRGEDRTRNTELDGPASG